MPAHIYINVGQVQSDPQFQFRNGSGVVHVEGGQTSGCMGNFCWWNVPISKGQSTLVIALLLLLYAWINRANLTWWWRKEVEKINEMSGAEPKKSPAPPSPRKRSQKIVTPSDELSGSLAQPPKPEDKRKVEGWYVYRSGKWHGPYEKFQLRSFERITAKSKIRRAGETDWQLAGQIEELKDFLS